MCVRNAGRSQLAAAITQHLAGPGVHVRSAGSRPAGEVDPTVVRVLGERGIELSEAFPKPLTDRVVRAADVIVTMGCGDACPVYPGKRYLDWDVTDPEGRPSRRSGRSATTSRGASPRCSASSGSDRARPAPLPPDTAPHRPPDPEGPPPMSTDRPSVLFVCVHNAGRSQMAAAYLAHLSGGAVEVRSAGSAPGERVNPVAAAAMLEEGIDISAEQPKVLTTEAVRDSDVVVTMGCGDTCPIFPGKRYEDWVLDDPAGQGLEVVRPDPRRDPRPRPRPARRARGRAGRLSRAAPPGAGPPGRPRGPGDAAPSVSADWRG